MTTRTKETLTMTDLTTELTVAAYISIIEDEAQALYASIPDALERQWLSSAVPRHRDEDERRASGGKSDPTADAATDPRRAEVRATLLRSRLALRDAAITLRGVRRALERSLDRYDGEVTGR